MSITRRTTALESVGIRAAATGLARLTAQAATTRVPPSRVISGRMHRPPRRARTTRTQLVSIFRRETGKAAGLRERSSTTPEIARQASPLSAEGSLVIVSLINSKRLIGRI